MKHPKKFDTDMATSKRMSKVKLKKGKAERILAKELWRSGFRYRLNDKKLPGSPDIAILKYKIAVFVDGEFWHGYEWIVKKTKLKRNKEYWIEKIEENMSRDDKVNKALIALGWIPIHFWSEEVLKNTKECVTALEELAFELRIRD